MFTITRGRLALVSAVAVGAVVALAGCASGDPLDEGNSSSGDTDTLVVGSQDYYSNEIIAEIYAQASWTVTQAFADTYGLTDIASLSKVTEPITVGGNSELETRPYGPTALKEKYGIDIAGFTPVEDNGGPLTVKSLVDNKIQLANVYTADPNISSNNLVALDDPDGLFFADNVVPVVSDKVDDGAAEIINAVSAKLTADTLVELNSQSVNDQAAADTIATDWLTKAGLL